VHNSKNGSIHIPRTDKRDAPFSHMRRPVCISSHPLTHHTTRMTNGRTPLLRMRAEALKDTFRLRARLDIPSSLLTRIRPDDLGSCRHCGAILEHDGIGTFFSASAAPSSLPYRTAVPRRVRSGPSTSRQRITTFLAMTYSGRVEYRPRSGSGRACCSGRRGLGRAPSCRSAEILAHFHRAPTSTAGIASKCAYWV